MSFLGLAITREYAPFSFRHALSTAPSTLMLLSLSLAI